MAKRSKRKSGRKSVKKSKCNSHGKKKTCPKKKCSWVKLQKKSKGKNIKGHCKGSPKKGTKKVSECRKKIKRSSCRSAKKCNWVKTHTGRNGVNIKPFCKSNPGNRSVSKRKPTVVQYNDGDDDSSDSSSSSDDDDDDVPEMNLGQPNQMMPTQGRVSAPNFMGVPSSPMMSTGSLQTPLGTPVLSSVPGSAESLQRQGVAQGMAQGNARGVPNQQQNGNPWAQYILLKSLMGN